MIIGFILGLVASVVVDVLALRAILRNPVLRQRLVAVTKALAGYGE